VGKPAYIELLRDPRWQRKKNAILERDDYRCQFCRDTETNLQAHHKRYAKSGLPWDVPNSWLITLCQRCHERVSELINRAREMLAEMNLYELPLAVESLEKLWSVPRVPAIPLPPRPPSPTDRQLTASAFRASIERYEEEKAEILALVFTRQRSHRVDVIDGHIAAAWDRLAPVLEASTS